MENVFSSFRKADGTSNMHRRTSIKNDTSNRFIKFKKSFFGAKFTKNSPSEFRPTEDIPTAKINFRTLYRDILHMWVVRMEKLIKPRKRLSVHFISMLSLVIIFAGCNMNSGGSGSESDGTNADARNELKYGKIIVDNLRMRDASGLRGKEITQIGQDQFVRITGNQSDTTDAIAIRGVTSPHYWHEIIFNGDTGWVYGGGLEVLGPEDMAFEGAIEDFIIEPGIRAGLATKNSTHASLVSQLSPGEVIKDQLQIGEGETVEGTILYPNTNNEMRIYWQNEDFEHIRQIIISKPGAEWQTSSGIHINQPIQEVTALNGTPFEMTGFQWDLAGTTLNWQGGKLDPKLTLSFDYQGDISVYPFLIGDKVISSDNSSLLKLKPKVRQILVSISE